MAKQDKNERQAKLDAMRKQQKSAEGRGNAVIIGSAVIVGALLIGAAAWKPVTDAIERRGYEDTKFTSIGVAADACTDVETLDGGGTQNHVENDSPLTYDEAPPTSGQHYGSWEPIGRKFYTADDRPKLGYLVHNLEHGYTILWYDETIANDAEKLADVKGLAAKFTGEDMRNKFKAVPWTKEDGAAFPEGQHIALTHWSAGGNGNTDPSKFVGVRQYCSAPSGAALEKFMDDYPYMDSPEPNAL